MAKFNPAMLVPAQQAPEFSKGSAAVITTFGNSSLVSFRCGYCLSSLRKMLYFGLCFFIRFDSRTSDSTSLALIKSIAVIDLFRNGSGLAAEASVLVSVLYDHSKKKVEDTLEQLASWKIILFKKHINAWSVFEGSDFDIESAISQARGALPGVDFALLSSLTNLFPVIAKRHYHHTGTMRWMDMRTDVRW